MLRKISDSARPLVRGLAAQLRYGPRMWRWELLSRLASDLGVDAFAVETVDGMMLSKVADRVVMPWLAQLRSFDNAALMDSFKEVLRDGGTYLDIGANLGVTTIPLAGQDRVQIHAFEPDPVNFRMLAANLAINCPAHRVTLHQIALGAENGTCLFELNPSNAGDNRIAGTGRAAMGEGGWQTIDVQVRRLDDVVQRFTNPLVVKIDAQGAEARIVAGGSRTLREADLITLEWYPYLLSRVGGDPDPVLSLVAAFERGSIVLGDGPASEPKWRTGREIAEAMRVALAKSSDAIVYYEVQVRRA